MKTVYPGFGDTKSQAYRPELNHAAWYRILAFSPVVFSFAPASFSAFLSECGRFSVTMADTVIGATSFRKA
jgi:hypothetical protein